MNAAQEEELLGLNKASRLHAIVQSMANQNDQTPLVEAWASALKLKVVKSKLSALDIQKHLLWMALELDLLEGELVVTQPMPEKVWCTQFQNLRQALFFSMTGKVANIRGYLDNGLLMLLSILAHQCVEDSVAYSEVEVDKLLNEVMELEILIKNSNTIPNGIRNLLLEKVREMRDAIAAMVISGTNGVEKVLHSLVGSTPFLNGLKDASQHQRDGLTAKLLRVIGQTAVVTGTQEATKPLLQKGADFLLGGFAP